MNANHSTSFKSGGDGEFMEWMSSCNPLLLSKYPTLSRESQAKLRSLFTCSLQADSCLDDALKTINRCDHEYEALAHKNLHCLQLLGLGDEEISCETQKLLQESATIIVDGNVGDGSDAGAAATLAVNFVNQTNTARQKLSLGREIKLIQKRNERLKEDLLFFEKEHKMAFEEVSSLQTGLQNDEVDLNVSQAKLSRLNRTVSLTKVELEELGVSPSISNQAIMDTHKELKSVLNEIKFLEEKFTQYGELPPSVTEATKILANTKQQLESVSNDLKAKLTKSFHKRN